MAPVTKYFAITGAHSITYCLRRGELAAQRGAPVDHRRNVVVRGTVRVVKDSLWLDLPHFDLPGSTGSATGKVVWGSGLPIRYAVDVVGDSVSMADIAWVYPTLPTTGSGRMKLRIENQPDNLRILDYAIRDMEVRTTSTQAASVASFATPSQMLCLCISW